MAPYWIGVTCRRLVSFVNQRDAVDVRGHFWVRSKGLLGRGFQEKLLNLLRVRPYRKPTQVCSSSRARRTSESTPRNSAKKRPYLRNKACPLLTQGAAAKESLATVYQKHSSLRTRKRMYRG